MRRSICSTPGKAARRSAFVKLFPTPTTSINHSAARMRVPDPDVLQSGMLILTFCLHVGDRGLYAAPAMSLQEPANAVDVQDVVKQRLKAAEEEGLAETVTI